MLDDLTVEQEEAIEAAEEDWKSMGLFSMDTLSLLINSGIDPDWLDEYLDDLKLC